MKDTEFAYAVAYIKTFENKMLKKADIEALINAPDYAAALKILADKGYATGADSDEVLKNELEKVWREAEEATPAGAPLSVLKYKNDFHNLKTVLKAFLTNANWEGLMLSPANVPPAELFEAVKRADFSELPEFIGATAEKAYKIITAEHDGQAAEIYIDKAAYEAMEKAASGNDFLEGWVELNAELANILIALRARGKSREFIEKALIQTRKIDMAELAAVASGGAEAVAEFAKQLGYSEGAELLRESIGEFEKWCDNQKTEYLKKARNRFFGFEPIMAFLLGKEAEIQAVRIILAGQKNAIPAEIIKERLRELYV